MFRFERFIDKGKPDGLQKHFKKPLRTRKKMVKNPEFLKNLEEILKAAI